MAMATEEDRLTYGGGTCSMSFLLPSSMREEIEKLARSSERSAGAVVRYAVKRLLEGDERDEAEWR